MTGNLSKTEEVNLLASEACWAWPRALESLFRPRGVNLMVAENADDFIEILEHRRIHTAIVDMDSEKSSELATVRIIKIHNPSMPCILLTTEASKALLDKALELNVFSVLNKPVDMEILRLQLNRLFMKKYNSNIFAE